MCVIDATSRVLGGFCAAFQKRRANPAGVTVSATHSTTHDDAAGHHHAGSPVRLQGGQRACVVSHEADYDGVRRNASNRTDAEPRSVTECYTLLNPRRGRPDARPAAPYGSALGYLLPNPSKLLRIGVGVRLPSTVEALPRSASTNHRQDSRTTTELAMVKINEVAEAAGVSISTVSYALSGKRPDLRRHASPHRAGRARARLQPERRRPDARRQPDADLRADRAAAQGHARADPHGVRARDRRRRPPQRLRHPAAHRRAREGRHGPRRRERTRRRDPGARCRARRRAGRARPGHLDPDRSSSASPTTTTGLICVDLDFEAATALAVDRLADAGHSRRRAHRPART